MTRTVKQKTYLKILIAIVALGFVLRAWRLTSLPLPPNGDELAFGYYGWSLLHYGMDEYGNKFPVYFSSIGDYKFPVLAYLNIIPATVFGLSEITVRFWPVVSGTLLIVLTYFLSGFVFANPLINLLSALFVAVSPWSITLSRTAHEVEVGMVFTYIALLAILYAARLLGKKGTNNQSSYMKVNTIFVVSFLLLLTSIFTYGSQRIFIPSVLLGLTAVAYFYKNELSNVKSRLAILFVIITALVGLSLIPWQARGRASGVVWRGVSQDQITNDAIYDGTGVIKTPIILTRIYHNKISENILDFSQNYLKNFNFNYLFFTGDTSPESTPQTGIVLHIELLLFVVGLLGVWKRQRGSNKAIPFVILITGAGASAITLGGPHMLRGSNMFPAIALFSAYGFFYIANSLVKNLWRKIVLILLGLLIFVNASFTTHQIFIHKPVQRPWYSDQTKAQLVSDTWSMRNNYKAVVMKEYPYIFFLFLQQNLPLSILGKF